MSVLQSVWLEVLVLGVAYRSIGCEEEVVFAEDFVLDEEMSRVAGLTELNAAISQLARRFRALNVDREEFVMLKAIALTNSGTRAVMITVFLCVWHSLKICVSVKLNIQPSPSCERYVHINSQSPSAAGSHLLFSCIHLTFCICRQIFFC